MSPPLVYVIAGESSGDLLGGRVMASLKRLAPGGVAFAGIGGHTMQAEGLAPLFPMAELSVMGLVEVLAHLPNLMRRIDQTVADILARRPAVVLTIDAPDFCFRVARRVRARNPSIRLVHYVAPTVWAWRPGRAKKIAAFLDHLLALLPFEPPYFDAVGLPCTFVGHSAVAGRIQGNAERFRAKGRVPADARIVLLLPGSRKSEVSRLLPLCLDVAHRLTADHANLFFAFPTVPHVAELLRDALKDFTLPHAVIEDAAEKADAFAAARAALAASGTVALELALAEIPSVICYRVNALSAFLAYRLVRTPYVALPNLILGRPVMPEFLQARATVDLIAPVLSRLVDGSPEREVQETSFGALPGILVPDGIDPSVRAAHVILDQITAAAVPPAAADRPARDDRSS